MALRLYGDGNIENVTSINTDVSSTELGYLDGVSSALQSQISNKSDYEQGTWVPILGSIGGCFSGVTGISNYSYNYYTKIGNVVTFWAYLELSGSVSNAEGILRLSGLPYTPLFPNFGSGSGQLYGTHGGSDSEVLVVGVNNAVSPNENIYVYRGTVNGTTAARMHIFGTYISS